MLNRCQHKDRLFWITGKITGIFQVQILEPQKSLKRRVKSGCIFFLAFQMNPSDRAELMENDQHKRRSGIPVIRSLPQIEGFLIAVARPS